MEHQNVLGKKQRVALHTLQHVVSLGQLGGQCCRCEIEAWHGQSTEGPNLPVRERLQGLIDGLLLGMPLESIRRLRWGGPWTKINEWTEGILLQARSQIRRWS